MRFSRGVSLTFVIIAGFLCSFLLFTAFLIVRHISYSYSPTVSNAQRYLEKGKIDEALAFANQIESDNAPVLILKGRIWLAKSYQKQKKEKWGSYGLDENEWLKGEEIQKAEEYFKAAKKKKPSGDEPYFYLGIIYSEKGWFFEAESEFEKALDRDPSRIDVRVSMSSLLVKMRKYDNAEEQLRLACLKEPQNPLIAKNMAFLFRYYKDKPDSALRWFNRYLNNASSKDLDVSLAKKEFRDLIERYPEFTPPEPQTWKENRKRFIPR